MKTESIAEFLARGGQITLVTKSELKDGEVVRPVAISGYASILSTADADLYHGESKPRKNKKKKKVVSIDISALPEELRVRFIDPLLNGEDNDDEE
jgi:hypothetical protein